MPRSQLQIPHNLGTDQAKERISKFAETVRQNPGPMVTDIEDSWNGENGVFRFRVLGMTISGTVKVAPTQIGIEVEYPLAAMPFKSHLEQDILAKANALLTA